MIYGVGTDLVEISRMEKCLESQTFVNRVFGPQEQAFLEQVAEKHRPASAAACFAAKEAFLKACGMGLGSLPLAQIQALRKESGAPYFALLDKAEEFCRERSLSAGLSLSHEAGLALAFVVLEAP